MEGILLTEAHRVGWARGRAGGTGDWVGQGTVLLGVECSRLLLLLLLWLGIAVVLDGRDVQWWRRLHRVTGEGWWPHLRRKVDRTFEGYIAAKGAYQQVVSVVGAVGEATRLFVIEFTPGSGVGAVGITAIRVVGGEVGGSTTDVWSEELGRTIFELSAKLEVVLSETSILILEFTDAVQRTHLVVGHVHSCLEPRDRLLELREREEFVNTDANGRTIGRRMCTCST